MSAVTILVPTFNRSAFLAECLNSLLAQTRRPDQIIVVDDGSSDDTAEVVRSSYAAHVEFLGKPNGGKASALNLGMQHVRGDYVWICDDDDLADPEGCAALAAALDQSPAAEFAYGRYRLLRRESVSDVESEPFEWDQLDRSDIFLALMECMFICQFSSMVRKRAFDAVGLFREDLLRSQDYDMILRTAERFAGVFTDRIVFRQRQHAGSRGPQADHFAAHSSEARWMKYDRMFFSEMRQRLPLERFTPGYAKKNQTDAWAARRSALIQRAVIYSRRGMVDVVPDDLVAAAEGEAPLWASDLKLVERVFIDDRSIAMFSENRLRASSS